MWEFCIIFNSDFVIEAKEISKKLKNLYANQGACIVIIERQNLCYMALAIKNEFQSKFVCDLKDFLSNAVVRYYKSQIIHKTIRNYDNLNNYDIIEALVNYDVELEIKEIKKSFDFSGQYLFMDNLFYFCHNEMASKWRRMASTICKNSRLFFEQETANEILEFIKGKDNRK